MINEQDLNERIDNFRKELDLIEIELNAFFLTKKLSDYCEVKVNRAACTFSIEIKNRNELPVEIIDRVTVAYLISNHKR